MFLPDNIDLGKSEKYVLNIRIRPDGFSFSIHDPEDEDAYCYLETGFSDETSLNNNIQRIIFDYNFLTNSFKKANVIVVSSRYELIPNSFYEKQKAKDLFAFSHNGETAHILTSVQTVQANELVFDLDESIYLFLYRSLYMPQFYHHSGLLMNYFSGKIANVEGNSMFVYFHGDFADVMCFDKKKKIIQAHTYQKETEKDLVYYILNTWRNCNFDQLSDDLNLYGYASSHEIKNTLKEYINNVYDIGNFEQIADFGKKIQNVPLDISILSV